MFLDRFVKNTQNLMKIPPIAAEMLHRDARKDGQTDR